jgi:hypothetical protein
MDELSWLVAAIIVVLGVLIYVKILDFAHFLGASVSVTFWALFTTIIVLPLIIFVLKKFINIKNSFLFFLSLPLLWYNWGQVLISHAKKSSVFGGITGFSYLNNFGNTLPWWGTSWFFWTIEIILIAVFAVYIALEHFNS